MKNIQSNERGFTHIFIAISIGLVLVIGATVAVVLTKRPDATKSQAVSTASNKPKAGTVIQSGSPAAAVTATDTTTPTTSQTTTTSKSKSTTSSSSAAAAPAASTTAQAPAKSSETPLSKLTSLITALQNGDDLDVTSSMVTVAGPISDAQARPIVFSLNGQTYYAYRQGRAANFNQTPAQTADTMAIITANAGASLSKAHLDKAANLVDIDFQIVGYSTGGN